ncbi:MAG: histidine--tRNA ligase [Kiritimatiellia bacterium]
MVTVSQSLQGMTDIEFPEVNLWQTLEARAREVMLQYDFREIRTPIVEMASVYLHSLGDTSEIVQKQMYAFETRGGKQVCLRPEGTAGVMRYVSGNLQELQDARLYYMGPMFRAERPQAGRKRQFHQLGVECIGAASAWQDAEVIAMQAALFRAWNLEGVVFQLNTRGSAEDFPRILEGLRGELLPLRDQLCADCQSRLENNVLRVLDCKNPACKEVVKSLPPITSWMAPESVAYFEEVRKALETFGVDVRVNPLLVRGLDYYQHTIWEVSSDRLGAQDALAGGGRYQMTANGKVIEGVGFGIGLERVVMALSDEVKHNFSAEGKALIVLVAQNDEAQARNLTLLSQLRDCGYRVRMDLTGRSMKSQMKSAARQRARWVLLRGEQELADGEIQLRDMETGAQRAIPTDRILAELGAL